MEKSGLIAGLASEQQTEQKTHQCSSRAVVTEILGSREFQAIGPGGQQKKVTNGNRRSNSMTCSWRKILVSYSSSKPISLA